MRSTIVFFAISLLVLIPFEAYANFASQTDWSGGPDVWGPVTTWGDVFYLANAVEWNSNPGLIALQKTITEFIIKIDFDGATHVYSADIDGDGDMDVLGAAALQDEITWWENVDASGTSWIEHIVDDNFDNPSAVYSEDIDDDGDMDVLGAASLGDDITWWENIDGSGTAWNEHTIDGDFDCAIYIYSEDIDDDGDMDVLGAARIAGVITWWENIDGSGTSWTEHIIAGDFSDVVSVYSEDIDDDGDMDVLGASVDLDAITWWENENGLGTAWTEHSVDMEFDGAHSVYSEDIDGDGDMDILGGAHYAGDISWWENSDTGSGIYWTEHIVDLNFTGVASVYSEDMDGDGDMDVLGAAEDVDDISWWENLDCSGTSWVEHTIDENFHDANYVYSEDINNDGQMDILGAALGSDMIAWWDLTLYNSCGSLESSVFDKGTDPVWDYFEWDATTTPNTFVSFQVRASNNYTNMGAWSDTLTSPCALTGILTGGDRYLQYRAILSTSDPDTTSILNDISITCNQLGVECVPKVTEFLLFGAESNPAFGSVSIGFAVPDLSLVELSIYDLKGRLVIAPAVGEYSQGIHQVQFGELASGIYFCRMRSGDFTETQQFVVIE